MPDWLTVLMSLLGAVIVGAIQPVLSRRKTAAETGKADAETNQTRHETDNSTAEAMEKIFVVGERQRNEALAAVDEARAAASEARDLATQIAAERVAALRRANVCERNMQLLADHIDAFDAWAASKGPPPPPKRPDLHPWPHDDD